MFLSIILRFGLKDLYTLFQQICNKYVNLSTLNYILLTLIPKKKAASQPSDYKSINLIHSCIKIFAKVLVNHLQPFMNSLVDPAQPAYVEGKSILDNILCTHKVLFQPKKSLVKVYFASLILVNPLITSTSIICLGSKIQRIS